MKQKIVLFSRNSWLRMFSFQIICDHFDLDVFSAIDESIFSCRNLPSVFLLDLEMITIYGKYFFLLYSKYECASPIIILSSLIAFVSLPISKGIHLTGNVHFPCVKNFLFDIMQVALSNQKKVATDCSRDISDNNIHNFVSSKYIKVASLSSKKSIIGKIQETITNIPERSEFSNLKGNSLVIKHLKQQILTFAPTDVPIILTGESGTGKTFIAEIIHKLSHVKNGPFSSVNVATIPESLAESELFGTSVGAFTGAVSKCGYFEESHNGTLFMDEISELNLNLQSKLLRIIEDKKVRRVGENHDKHINVRFLFASNRDILKDVCTGRFRADLWYRINVVVIHIPPLRERKEDIQLLISDILSRYNKTLTKSALNKLYLYSWPGNIRELKNTIIRACLTSTSSIVTEDDIDLQEVKICESITAC